MAIIKKNEVDDGGQKTKRWIKNLFISSRRGEKVMNANERLLLERHDK